MKKFNQNNKLKKILFSVLCYCVSMVTVYFLHKEQAEHFDLFEFLSSLFIIVILITGGTYQIIALKKEKNINVSEQEFIDKQKRNAKLAKQRQKRQRVVRIHKSMFREFYWYIVETTFMVMLALFIPCTIFCFAIWKWYTDISIWWLLAFWGIVLVLFMIYCVCLLFEGPVKRLKETISRSGYDIETVNSDYMHGRIYIVMAGILNVGFQYTVYAGNNKFTFIVPNNQIVSVEKIHQTIEITDLNHGKDKEERYSIRINTNKYQRNCISNDIEADLILEEFERLGIPTRKCSEPEKLRV
ncbi:MAG: hypothetical protein K2H34_05245 [Lachnospiraceae bacterium]|nr:hypothetical protein [Lachnospiraceae bacterium]